MHNLCVYQISRYVCVAVCVFLNKLILWKIFPFIEMFNVFVVTLGLGHKSVSY